MAWCEALCLAHWAGRGACIGGGQARWLISGRLLLFLAPWACLVVQVRVRAWPTCALTSGALPPHTRPPDPYTPTRPAAVLPRRRRGHAGLVWLCRAGPGLQQSAKAGPQRVYSGGNMLLCDSAAGCALPRARQVGVLGGGWRHPCRATTFSFGVQPPFLWGAAPIPSQKQPHCLRPCPPPPPTFQDAAEEQCVCAAVHQHSGAASGGHRRLLLRVPLTHRCAMGTRVTPM